MSETHRERWSGRLGFTLAAVGSAVGLGNMWRFSYMTAENGGAAFVVLYLAMTLFVGLPIMLAELTVGRSARRSPIQALVYFGGPAWKPLGGLFVAAGFVILSYYSVIAGWTVRYALESVAFGFPEESGAHFEAIATGVPAVLWHLGFMAVTALVVSRGIRSGIERVSLVLMPLLALLVIGLAIYAATLDGAAAGYDYYLLQTGFWGIVSVDVLKDAASQAFFSLSLGMGAMLTYASYLSREHHLPDESLMIAVSDFGVAFVAGLVVFPLLFAFGLQGDLAGGELETVGALFITLPQAFANMGPAGQVIGLLFFLALMVGALTSAISLLEVVAASVIDGLGWNRRRVAWLSALAIAVLGIPSALSLDVLELMDRIGGKIFLLLGGLLLALMVGWGRRDPIPEAREGAEGVRGLFLWRSLLRYLVPAVLAVVLIFALRDTWSAIVDLVDSPG
jgi:NSS family neurotransmitter:Na+ symporter